MTSDFGEDLIACAQIVERADPVRFRAAMAAPVAARRVLFPVYAFNVEVARAPWVTAEPLIAAMRLQWWRDVLDAIAEGGPVRRHEVALPLALAIDAPGARLLDGLVAARMADTEVTPFPDRATLSAYLDATSGNLVLAAARALGPADEEVIRDAAWALGLANWLRAVPALIAAGRVPLPGGPDAGVAELADEALDRLARARARRGAVSRAAGAALLPLAGVRAVLEAARTDPEAVTTGLPERAPMRDRTELAWRAATGRW